MHSIYKIREKTTQNNTKYNKTQQNNTKYNKIMLCSNNFPRCVHDVAKLNSNLESFVNEMISIFLPKQMTSSTNSATMPLLTYQTQSRNNKSSAYGGSSKKQQRQQQQSSRDCSSSSPSSPSSSSSSSSSPATPPDASPVELLFVIDKNAKDCDVGNAWIRNIKHNLKNQYKCIEDQTFNITFALEYDEDDHDHDHNKDRRRDDCNDDVNNRDKHGKRGRCGKKGDSRDVCDDDSDSSSDLSNDSLCDSDDDSDDDNSSSSSSDDDSDNRSRNHKRRNHHHHHRRGRGSPPRRQCKYKPHRRHLFHKLKDCFRCCIKADKPKIVYWKSVNDLLTKTGNALLPFAYCAVSPTVRKALEVNLASIATSAVPLKASNIQENLLILNSALPSNPEIFGVSVVPLLSLLVILQTFQTIQTTSPNNIQITDIGASMLISNIVSDNLRCGGTNMRGFSSSSCCSPPSPSPPITPSPGIPKSNPNVP